MGTEAPVRRVTEEPKREGNPFIRRRALPPPSIPVAPDFAPRRVEVGEPGEKRQVGVPA